MFEIYQKRQNTCTDLLHFKETHFSAGETCISLFKDFDNEIQFTTLKKDLSVFNIVWKYKSDAEMMTLLNIVRTLRQCGAKNIELSVPYFPHSRMDRVMSKNVSFSLKNVIDIINLCNFDKVTTEDAHSDAIEMLMTDNTDFDNLSQVYCYYDFMQNMRVPDINENENTVIVSPDAGASKKIFNFAGHFGIEKIISASKNRDTATGDIISTTINKIDISANADIWVIDDICDGGRTFIELAKVLKKEYPTNKLFLYTTHGIYSKGIKLLDEHYAGVYCRNDMSKW